MADEKQEGEQASTLSEDELLEAKLAAFDEKVKKAGATAMPHDPDWSYNRQNKPAATSSPMGGIGFGLSLLYTLLAPILAGFLIGLIVDKARHTEGAYGTGALIGMVCGFIAMIIFAVHQMRREDKR